jgi:iron complex outermembrane recepter protein
MGFTKSVSMFRTVLCAGVAATSLAMPQLAFAEEVDAAEAPAAVEEITVFARRDAESLQNVPLTITAIGAATLAKYNVNKVSDIVSRIPTLNVQIGGSGAGAQLSLRGVGSSNISAAFDSAVALDFDGVQVSTSRLLQAGFVDPAQIDVLKGPQSLYFGKSASAGVLQIRTADPTSTWQYGAMGSYEFEEKGYLINGFVSGPLSDTFGVRLAAQYNDVNEYVKIAPGTPALLRNRGLRDFVGRATFQWEPSSDFKANLKATYTRNTNDGAIGTGDVSCGANGRADEVVLLSGAIAIPSNADCNPFNKFVTTSDPSATAVKKFPDGSAGANGGYPGRPFGKTDLFFTRLLMNAKLADNIKVVSTTGFMKLKAVDFDSYSYLGVGSAFNPNGVPVAAIAPALAAVNGPGTPQGMGSSDPENKTSQFTQELRFVSNFSGMFNFTLGAFYEKRTIDFNTSQQGVNISIIAPDPVTGNTYDWYKKHRTKTDAYSLFGSGTLTFTDQLELTGGVRWTKEKKVNTITVPYVHTFLSSGPAFIDSGFFSGPIPFNDSQWTPEVTLRYKINPDVNVYAAFKTGFKSGGIDNSALPSSNLLGLDNPATRDAVAAGLIFRSETSRGGEIGFKSQLANRTITLNATAYYYVFKNLQVQNFNATTIQFITTNAGEVTTKGIDVDFSWRPPVDGLRFTGAAAYTNAEFTGTFITGTGPDGIAGTADDPNIDGRRAARAPRFAGNIAFDYTAPLSDALEFGMSGNFAYSGSYYTRQENVADYIQPSFATIDGSISVGAPDGRWKLALIGNNITNKIFVNTSGGRPFLAGPGGLGTPGSATFVPQGDDEVFTVNRGRQVFIQGTVKF